MTTITSAQLRILSAVHLSGSYGCIIDAYGRVICNGVNASGVGSVAPVHCFAKGLIYAKDGRIFLTAAGLWALNEYKIKKGERS